MKQPRHIFGRRTWTDVRGVITARTRRRFPRAKFDDIEDAVSWAMVDLVDYWIQLGSSVVEGDPEKTFWRACKRGTWMATTFITQDWDDKDVPSDAIADILDSGAPREASVEDVALHNVERERLVRFTRSRFCEFGDWLRPYLAGHTTYEQAEREGVTQSAISRRWGRRKGDFVAAAEAAGLALS